MSVRLKLLLALAAALVLAALLAPLLAPHPPDTGATGQRLLSPAAPATCSAPTARAVTC